MKTTVKSDHGRAVVYPFEMSGEIAITLSTQNKGGPDGCATLHLTPDQAGVLIFGLEQALASIQPATVEA